VRGGSPRTPVSSGLGQPLQAGQAGGVHAPRHAAGAPPHDRLAQGAGNRGWEGGRGGRPGHGHTAQEPSPWRGRQRSMGQAPGWHHSPNLPTRCDLADTSGALPRHTAGAASLAEPMGLGPTAGSALAFPGAGEGQERT